ncbi:hypothetical protein R1sor_007081 [Riccia sorocarpa]|uniref:Uncharacterized protein n=1 Tax=Riccia sorocarpa TaxID=122646 RepID=A0ABD3HT28_9MARC
MEDPNRKLQEMADKLEKSEVGRKKLRQAITLLKEKLEATEKVLEVNDSLRQECEKERLRAESEKKKAEEEKALRIQTENENTSTKEQLAIVLQRLDALERSSKVDRAETLRVRGEVKHALSALHGAVQLAETAHSSVQGLEKFVQDKVVDSVSTSTRALALAQSVTSDIKAAQATGASAEKTSQSLASRLKLVQKQNAGYDQRINLLQQETTKASSLAQNANSDAKAVQVTAASAEKLSQSLASRIAAMQKQFAGLDQRVNHLQQELRTRFVDTGSNFDGAKTGKAAVPRGEKKAASKGMVLSKSQQLSGDNAKLPEPIQIVDSGSSSGCMSSLFRDIDSSGKNRGNNPTRVSSVSAITTRDSLASTPTSVVGTHSRNFAKPPVSFNGNVQSAEGLRGQENMHRSFKGGVNVVSTNVLVSGESDGSLKKKDAGMPQSSAPTGGKLLALKNTSPRPTNLDFSGRQSICGGGNTGKKIQCLPSKVAEPERGLHGGDDKVVRAQRKELLPAALLKDITKLFSKEKRVKSKLEGKFTALEQLLRSGEETRHPVELASAQEGKKRKCRDNVPGRIKGDCKRSKKISKLDLAPDCRAKLAVESCSFSLGGTLKASNAKDGVLVNSSISMDLTPQSTLPVVVETAAPADLCTKLKSQKKAGRDIISIENNAESCVSDLSDRDKCQGVQQVPEGVEGNRENVSVVDFRPDVIVDDSGACSPSLPLKSGTSANDSVEDMDIDKGVDNPVPDETRCGWDTESEMSDDEFDLEWWATKRVLLSPTLPPLRHSSELIEDQTLDVGFASDGSKEISLEDIARFLEVLPAIGGELCDSEREDRGGQQNGEAMPRVDTGTTAVLDERGAGDIDKLDFSGTHSLTVDNRKLENSEAVASLEKEEKGNKDAGFSASRSQVLLAGLSDNDEVLRSQKTNIVSLPGSFANSREYFSCGPGEDLEDRSSKLTTCDDRREQIHGISARLRKEPGGDADADARGDRQCVGAVCMDCSETRPPLTKADTADNTSDYADTQKFNKTNREQLGILEESEMASAQTEDVGRRVTSEGKAKDDSGFGLKLLEGSLGNGESIRSSERATDKGSLTDIREIAAIVTKTRNRLAGALEDGSASDVKSCRAASEAAICFAESRLSALPWSHVKFYDFTVQV